MGFHTRNVVHKGHEFVQKEALNKAKADALFISPVIGKKKAGDFTAKAILKSYETMIQNGYYKPYGVLLCAFNTYARYSGPREAFFTAVCRKNFGCSHFIIGRDHTGVNNFYDPKASQKLFDKLNIKMEIMLFDTAKYCPSCDDVLFSCNHGESAVCELSGTSVREMVRKGAGLQEYLMRNDVAGELFKLYNENPSHVFEEES